MTKGLLKSRRKKLKLGKKLKHKPDNVQLGIFYRTYRNTYNKLVEISRSISVNTRIVVAGNNPKEVWKVLREYFQVIKPLNTL